MIWFFIAGFISGAAGMILYAHWWMGKHTTVIRLTPEDEDNKNEEDKTHE